MSRPLAPTRRCPRRLGAVLEKHPLGLLFVMVGLLVALLAAGGGAEPDLTASRAMDPVIVAPGQTLWDIAVAHAPPDTDPRAYLLRMRDVNGLDGRPVPAWTVVYLPHPHPTPRPGRGAVGAPRGRTSVES